MEANIELEFEGEFIKGVLINEDDKYLMVKLDSGYNANLLKSKCSNVKKENVKVKSMKVPESIFNSKLPKIAVLHTGGTIASKVDYKTGAVTSKFTPEELLSLYPELNEVANLKAKMIGNLSSEDLNFNHWNLLLEAIKESIAQGCVGVIISHGTDTMHYSSAALEYASRNLSIPVLLIGAQRSADRPSSDAYSNLKAGINFILDCSNKKKSFRRVGICMHNSSSMDEFVILDGINSRKMHSTRRDAFKQINFLPFAKISDRGVEILRSDLESEKPSEAFEYTEYNVDLKIGFFKSHPNTLPGEIERLSYYDGVIVEGTGLGHLPVSEFDKYTKINLKNLAAVKKVLKDTKMVVGVQTVYGQTNLNIYSSGKYLLETGVLGNYFNLTTESLFCRLAFCLSQNVVKFEDIWDSNLEGFDYRDVFLGY